MQGEHVPYLLGQCWLIVLHGRLWVHGVQCRAFHVVVLAFTMDLSFKVIKVIAYLQYELCSSGDSTPWAFIYLYAQLARPLAPYWLL